MESSGNYERLECGKACLELGRTVLSDNHGRNEGLLSGGYGRETLT